MLQTMVSVIDTQRTIHMQVHDGLADIALAALSAEPETIDELRAAMGRYVDQAVADDVLEQAEQGLASRTVEGGHLILDLTARLIVNTMPITEVIRVGNVQACDQFTTLEDWLPYCLPDDWEVVTDASQWQDRASARRRQRAAISPIDDRQVLYGKLATCLVQHWHDTVSELEDPVSKTQDWWLLTPRADLGGRTPREILLARRKLIDADVQDQGQIWMTTGRCPPALSPRTHAYRFGGFGSHEIILYHELTTRLLLQCEQRIRPGSEVDLRAEIRRLEQCQQEWLHQPHQSLYDQSPAAMIARERSRLPAVVPAGHSEEHDDCPICRMMFESGQPMFWQLDNLALDSRFAISLHDSYEAWQEAQAAWTDLDQQWQRRAEKLLACDERADEPPRVWQHSHTNMKFFEGMPPLEACNVMLFSLGGHLGELIEDLKAAGAPRDIIRLLHERFDDLRLVLKEQGELWKLQTAICSFSESLQEIIALRGDLHAKCADLEDKLDFFSRRYQEHFGQDLEATL